MAVEIGKVIPVLDAKLKDKGLTKTYRDNLARTLAAKIDKEEDIETHIDGIMDILAETNKEGDRRATQAAKTKEQELQAKLKGDPTDTPPADPPDDVPADTPVWAKALLREAKAARAEVAALKAERQSESIADRVKKDERTKDIPAAFYKGRPLPTAEDFDKFADELKGDYSQFATEHKLSAFGNDAPAGSGKKPLGKEASKEELDAVMPNLLNS